MGFFNAKSSTDSQFWRGLKVQLGGHQLNCSPGWLWQSSCCLTAVCWSVWNQLVGLVHFLGDRSALPRLVPFLACRRCAVSWRDGVGWAGDCGVFWLLHQAEDEAFCWRGGTQMSIGMGNFPPALLQILRCLANKKEQSALPASCYVTQLESGAYKIHFRGPSFSPRD